MLLSGTCRSPNPLLVTLACLKGNLAVFEEPDDIEAQLLSVPHGEFLVNGDVELLDLSCSHGDVRMVPCKRFDLCNGTV